MKDGREREGESADKENKDGVKGKTEEVQKRLEELEERPDGSKQLLDVTKAASTGSAGRPGRGRHMCERHSGTCEWDESAR